MPRSHIRRSKVGAHSICKSKSNQAPFEPYTGPRWKLPYGINITQSVRYKFGLFENDTVEDCIEKINREIKMPLSFLNTYYVINMWKPPQRIISAIQSYRELQINEYKKVKTIYLKIFRFIRMFKKLVYTWRVNKCMRNVKNTEDPVTLDVPKKPIYVIDFKQGLSYIYEASSLRRTIEDKLLYSEYMFPESKKPINLLSNEPFTYGQLLSIMYQCRAYGEFSWVLDRFKSCDCDMHVFKLKFKQMLKIHAIESHFKSYKDSRDSVVDYFESQAETSVFLLNKIDEFSELYVSNTRVHPYILKWIALTKRYYIALELNDSFERVLIGIDSDRLILLGRTVF